jgi:arsenate reductase
MITKTHAIALPDKMGVLLQTVQYDMAENPHQHNCRIYGIKNCDTMKKAFAWLEAKGLTYEFVDYKKPCVAEAHLSDWNRRVGWKTLLNTRGLMWKKLADDERADVDEAKALALMARHPALIKRPVLDTGKDLLIGFDAERYARELTP